MILMWASTILGFSLEKRLMASALKLMGMATPSSFMNLLMKNPVVAINKLGSLPPKYRKAIEKSIKSSVEKKFKGSIKVEMNFEKLSKQVNKDPKLAQFIQKWNDNNVEVKKNGAVDINEDAIANVSREKTDKLEAEVGQFVKMSSSWITGGVLKGAINNTEVEADIYIHGKPYDFTLKKSVWNRMVRAIGSNGTGAGSVLWDSEFRFKRKAVSKKRAKYSKKGSK